MGKNKEERTEMPGCIAWFIMIAFGLFCTLSWYGKSETFRLQEVKKYCSEEQLVKTGEYACTSAKKSLKETIKQHQESLKRYRGDISLLEKDRKARCSETGLKEYGTEGCRNATEKLKKKTDAAEKLQQRITTLEKEVRPLKQEAQPILKKEVQQTKEEEPPAKEGSSLGLKRQLTGN